MMVQWNIKRDLLSVCFPNRWDKDNLEIANIVNTILTKNRDQNHPQYILIVALFPPGAPLGRYGSIPRLH